MTPQRAGWHRCVRCRVAADPSAETPFDNVIGLKIAGGVARRPLRSVNYDALHPR